MAGNARLNINLGQIVSTKLKNASINFIFETLTTNVVKSTQVYEIIWTG